VLGSRRRPSFPALLAIVVTTAFAFRASRNIALFGLVAWPLIALHLLKRPAERTVGTSGIPSHRVGVIAAPFACLLLLVGALHGQIAGRQLIADSVDSDRFPVDAVRRLRAGQNQANTLTTWVWSGYVPFAWPGKRVFFDPLLFSPAILDRFGEMLLTRPGWRQQLAKNEVGTVILPRGVPLADSLARDIGWTEWHRDGTAVVYLRRNPQVAVR
ncbi:MAG TPA: hypothetical protein VGP95_20360, partial [Gemmatimonadaceae bacterium]|nr:hypothetical protein [Gemmatimonadaceae bacterium]